MEQKETLGKWYTKEELAKVRKSDYYRTDLEPYIGEKITIDVSSCEIEPFKEDKDRACLRGAEVVRIGDQHLFGSEKIGIEHIWVALKKSLNIDPTQPLRAIGYLYEYPHKCGKKVVKNIGLNVLYVNQRQAFA